MKSSCVPRAGQFVFLPNTTAPVVGRSQLGGRPMIEVNNKCDVAGASWQTNFIIMLPEIERRLRRTFAYLDPEAHDESVHEGITMSLFAYVRLHDQGRAHV